MIGEIVWGIIICLIIGAVGYTIYHETNYDNCIKEIGKKICEERGFLYYQLDYAILLKNEKDGVLCVSKDKREITETFLFLQEEKESCRK